MPLALLLLAAAGPARAADEPPVALAGLPFLAYPDDTVELDGSGSYDPEGAELNWRWTSVGGPVVPLADGDTSTPRFTAQDPGVYSFELVVSDGAQDSAPDVVDVIVVDPEAGTRLVPPPEGCAVLSGGPASAGLALAVAVLARRRRS